MRQSNQFSNSSYLSLHKLFVTVLLNILETCWVSDKYNYVLFKKRRNTPSLRDWSLITGRGGGLQNGKIAGPKLFAPPPQDWVKLFAPPLLKGRNFLRPPNTMAKTSSFRVKNYLKTFCAPPPAWLKLFPPPPFRRGKTPHAPPPVL